MSPASSTSTTADGYDDGGIIPGPGFKLSQVTLQPVVFLSPEQTQAYLAAAKLVDRWTARDKAADQGS